VTAAELYELVKDCPEVWPARLEFSVYATADGEWICPDSGGFVTSIPDDYAADLILAGVVRKLWEYKNGCEFDYRPSDATYFVSTYVNDVGFTVSTHSSPTPLHAALAAYRKTRQ
jgi:hypothetical protein